MSLILIYKTVYQLIAYIFHYKQKLVQYIFRLKKKMIAIATSKDVLQQKVKTLLVVIHEFANVMDTIMINNITATMEQWERKEEMQEENKFIKGSMLEYTSDDRWYVIHSFNHRESPSVKH